MKHTEKRNKYKAAIAEIGKLIEGIEKLQSSQIKPLRLSTELHHTDEAKQHLGKVIAMLHTRIGILDECEGIRDRLGL